MRIDFSIDVAASVMDAVTNQHLAESMMLALSCMGDHPKGVALHPGMTIEWNVTRDEDAFV
jgi:hypothetical protein